MFTLEKNCSDDNKKIITNAHFMKYLFNNIVQKYISKCEHNKIKTNFKEINCKYIDIT